MGDFLKDAVGFVRDQARAAQQSGEDGLLGLASHLFAVASLTLSESGSSRVEVADRELRTSSLPRRVDSLRELLSGLADLPATTDAPALYTRLVTALQAIEDELLKRPRRDPKLAAGTTELSGAHLGQARVAGTMLHWLRPRSLYALERDLRNELAGEGPPGPAPHPITHLRRLGLYWERGGDGARLRLPVPPRRNTSLLVGSEEEILRHERFRIALCPLPGDFRPQFEVTPDGRRFRARQEECMVNGQALCEHLALLADEATARKVHLLVLPELTVDLPARDHLARLLRGRSHPFGVIAGSFHVWENGEELPVNESRLIDETGNFRLTHRKKGRYELASRKIHPHFFPGELPPLAAKVLEDIRWGNELQILETPVGRLAILICADAIEKNAHHGFEQVVERIRPDLTFIVSMSPETQPFVNLMESLSRARVGAFFVNAHCLLEVPGTPLPPPEGGELLAACNLALYEDSEMPPTRLRWRHRAADAECIYFRPKDGKKGWRPLGDAEDALGPTGASWLERDGKRLALVVDVARQMKEVLRRRRERNGNPVLDLAAGKE